MGGVLVGAIIHDQVDRLTGAVQDAHRRPQPLGLHSSNGAGSYYPDDFLSAYNAGSLANADGQTIGLTLWGGPVAQSDLNNFATTTGTPALVSGQAGSDGIDWILVNGGSTDQSSQPEEAMDVEYAHGMAPGSHLKYWLADTLLGTCDASGNNCWPDVAKPPITSPAESMR